MWGGNLCGRKPALGGNLWAESCGRKPAWAESCGRKPVGGNLRGGNLAEPRIGKADVNNSTPLEITDAPAVKA